MSLLSLSPLLCLLLLLSVCSWPLSAASAVHFTRSHTSSAWIPDTSVASSNSTYSTPSHASPDAAHSFIWLFPTTNQDWLKQQFEEVIEPSSPRYLQHLTFGQIQAATGPAKTDKDAVKAWLVEGGVSAASIGDYGHALSVQTTVSVIERLFNASMHRFSHRLTNTSATIAIDGVYIPAPLVDKLASLHGLYNHPAPIRGKITTFRTPLPVQPPSSSLPSPTPPASPAPRARFHTLQAQEAGRSVREQLS